MKKNIQIQHILTELKDDINALLGFHEDIPRINYGPCAVFAKLFYDAWNARFTDKVHICFVMTLDREECDHVVVKLPWGEFYDGGIGLHTDASANQKFLIDEMLVYDHDKLEQLSYGLDRTYPRFCPDFDKNVVDDLINQYLDQIKNLLAIHFLEKEMNQVTVYHNARCSKSRQTLEILQSHGITPIIIEYLKTPLNLEQITQLRSHFDLKDFVRSNEPVFKELNLTLANENKVLQAMVEEPILMQRPIVTCGDKSIIARPPEKVLSLLSEKQAPFL